MIIDKEKIKQVIECDDDFLNDLLENFVLESKTSLEYINEALIHKNYQAIKGSSHKLLSSTRIFEMNKLTELLKTIEIASMDNEKLDSLNDLIKELNLQMNKAFDEISTS